MEGEKLQSVLSHVEPVLAVKDIAGTIDYCQKILGFRSGWTWGDPPNHGGVSWQGASIQFSLDPSLAVSSEGNSLFFRVSHLEELYAFHKSRGVEVAEELENKPWGLS